jgi:O-antigen/teichoic acid export membrane protein
MKKNKLLKAGSIYLVASILANMINIFLIPLYTNNLTTSEFGQFNIVASIQGLLAIFISVGIYSGMSRFLYEYEDKNRIKNITFTFSLLWGLLVIGLGYIFSPILADLVFRDDSQGVLYVRFIIVNAVLISMFSVYETYFSMNYRAILSGLMQVAKVLFTLLFAIYFVVLEGYNIEGILYSQFCAFTLIIMAVVIKDIKNIRLIFGKKELKEQLTYGLGLMPGQVSNWVLTLIDRFFIKEIVSLSAVGIYSLGYMVGTLIQPLFIIPFSKIFTPYKYQVYKEDDGKAKIRNMFKYYNVIGWFIIFGLAIFAHLAIQVLGTSEYSNAKYIVWVIAFSYFLWGLGAFYGLGLHIANKMFLNSGIASLGAIGNIIFNIILIPIMSFYGAAIATVLAYMFMNIIYYYAGKKYYDIEVSKWSPYKYGLVFAIMYPIYLLISTLIGNVWIEIPINVLLCIIYIVLNIKVGFLSKVEAIGVVTKVKEKLKRGKK